MNEDTETEIIDGVNDTGADSKKTVLIASIITAAVVSAATAGYIVWRKTHTHTAHDENVQELLDKAHKTLHTLEDRLEDLRDSVALAKKSRPGTATA